MFRCIPRQNRLINWFKPMCDGIDVNRMALTIVFIKSMKFGHKSFLNTLICMQCAFQYDFGIGRHF